MDIGKNLFTGRVVKHCSRLPREMVDSPFLEIFKRSVDMIAWGHGLVALGTAGLTVGLHGLKDIFQPKQFYEVYE